MQRLSVGRAFSLGGRRSHGLSGLEGKPLHPPLTDVPIGAYLAAVTLDVISLIWRDAAWSDRVFDAAGYTMLVGFGVSLLTALTGFADWTRTEKGSEVRRMASTHGLLMVATTIVVATNLALRFFASPAQGLIVVLSLVAAALLFFGATIGGSLVYDHGFNVSTAKDTPDYHPSERDGRLTQREAERERVARGGPRHRERP